MRVGAHLSRVVVEMRNPFLWVDAIECTAKQNKKNNSMISVYNGVPFVLRGYDVLLLSMFHAAVTHFGWDGARWILYTRHGSKLSVARHDVMALETVPSASPLAFRLGASFGRM